MGSPADTAQEFWDLDSSQLFRVGRGLVIVKAGDVRLPQT